jgi:hypothetical protein
VEKTKAEGKGFFAKFFGSKEKSPKKEKKVKTPKVSRFQRPTALDDLHTDLFRPRRRTPLLLSPLLKLLLRRLQRPRRSPPSLRPSPLLRSLSPRHPPLLPWSPRPSRRREFQGVLQARR